MREFYIDGIIQDFPFKIAEALTVSSPTFEVTSVADIHELKWVYIQNPLSSPGYITLSNVTISATIDGAASKQTPCPAGTF